MSGCERSGVAGRLCMCLNGGEVLVLRVPGSLSAALPQGSHGEVLEVSGASHGILLRIRTDLGKQVYQQGEKGARALSDAASRGFAPALQCRHCASSPACDSAAPWDGNADARPGDSLPACAYREGVYARGHS